MTRVLVVDDSAVCRGALREILEQDGRAEVVGEAASGPEALALVARLDPALVTMDVRMPGMDGLETIARLMAHSPRPILVVTELPGAPSDALVFDAIRVGALDVVRKPSLSDAAAGAALRDRIQLLSRVAVVRRPAATTGRPPSPPILRRSQAKVVGIGASAGGPKALAVLLPTLDELAAPIAIVQHLPVGFADSFASFLRSRTRRRVLVAREPVALAPDLAVVAPDDRHLVAVGTSRVGPLDAPPRGGHRPSVDVLFESLAKAHGPAAAGIVLSGIGRDGAQGLLQIRKAGGLTVAQSERSAAVFGMPRAAIELGAALETLDLEAMSGALAPAVAR